MNTKLLTVFLLGLIMLLMLTKVVFAENERVGGDTPGLPFVTDGTSAGGEGGLGTNDVLPIIDGGDAGGSGGSQDR